jgi:hypothetical protein
LWSDKKKELGRWVAAGPGRRDGPRVGKMGQAGPQRVWAAGKRKRKEGEKRGFDLFFLFFQTPFKPLFKTLFKSNLLHKFLQTFHKPFSQLFLKTFKATQQQTDAFQHDAQTLGYFLN